jgi:hypothetical protein
VEARILPRGIRHLSVSAFVGMRLKRLSFSPFSMNFTVCDSIVQDISGRRLIQYLGKRDTVGTEWSIEWICEEWFMSWKSVKSVIFEENWHLS